MSEHAEGDGETAPEGAPRALVAELRAVHGAADRFAREVFEFRDAVAIPAMNELRYAGHHLLRALADDGSVVDAEQLRKAISHCQRAQYEAAEAGILAALGNIDRFKEDYKSLPIGECVVNYQDITASARRPQNVLAGERSAEGPDIDGGLSDPTRYMDTFRDLRDKWFVLDGSRDELAKLARKERKETRRFIISIALSIIAILISGSIFISMILK